MELLDSRTNYKPLEYPWAYDFYQLSEKMHQLPQEVQLDKDVRNWNQKLIPQEGTPIKKARAEMLGLFCVLSMVIINVLALLSTSAYNTSSCQRTKAQLRHSIA